MNLMKRLQHSQSNKEHDAYISEHYEKNLLSSL